MTTEGRRSSYDQNLISDKVYYTFELLQYQTEWLPWQEFLKFWPRDLLAHGTIALAFSLLYFYREWRMQKAQLLGVLFLSILAGTYMSRMKLGGYDNVLMPFYAFMAITMGLGVYEFAKMAPPRRSRISNITLYLLLIFQLGNLYYDPIKQIPSSADLKAGQEFVKYLSSIDGQIYIPDHPYLLALAGKPAHAHNSAIWDVLRGKGNNRGKDILEPALTEAIKNQHFTMIIIDTQWDIIPHLPRYYQFREFTFEENEYFYPVTGAKIRPAQIYTPRILSGE